MTASCRALSRHAGLADCIVITEVFPTVQALHRDADVGHCIHKPAIRAAATWPMQEGEAQECQEC